MAGRNYSGSSPRLLANAYLERQLQTRLPQELERLPDAVIVPLGPVVRDALEHLARRRLIDIRRVIPGLVHPSGANAERIACFLGTKAPSAVSVKTDAARILSGRAAAVRFIEGLKANRAA